MTSCESRDTEIPWMCGLPFRLAPISCPGNISKFMYLIKMEVAVAEKNAGPTNQVTTRTSRPQDQPLPLPCMLSALPNFVSHKFSQERARTAEILWGWAHALCLFMLESCIFMFCRRWRRWRWRVRVRVRGSGKMKTKTGLQLRPLHQSVGRLGQYTALYNSGMSAVNWA